MNTQKIQNHYETEQLTARIRRGLHGRMKAATPLYSKVGRLWSLAGELFLDLPRECQLELLNAEPGRSPCEILKQMFQDSAMRAAAVEDEQGAYEVARKARQDKQRRKIG